MLEETEFPESIEGFGYKFNEKGELRDINTDERFSFYIKPEDRSYNQRRYEKLGEVIGSYIEDKLEKEYDLTRKIIPVGSEEDDNVAKSRIYQSGDAQECQTLLLLIQGSGVVRPGQWARQVIINDSLELGTMFPYIRKAQELNWGIIIFNPNENYGSITKDGKIDSDLQIPGSGSPQEHCLYVWDSFVKKSKAEKILIVAHSYGGICTLHMLECLGDEFKSRVKGIALTDSVHSSGMVPTHSKKWFTNIAWNWIKSYLDIDVPVPEAKQFYGCNCVSAGHPKHEYTSGIAFESVFNYLQEKCNKKTIYQENKPDEQLSVTNNEDTTMLEESQKDFTKVIESPKAAPDKQSNSTENESSKNLIDKQTEETHLMETDNMDDRSSKDATDKQTEDSIEEAHHMDANGTNDGSSETAKVEQIEDSIEKAHLLGTNGVNDRSSRTTTDRQIRGDQPMELDESSRTATKENVPDVMAAAKTNFMNDISQKDTFISNS